MTVLFWASGRGERRALSRELVLLVFYRSHSSREGVLVSVIHGCREEPMSLATAVMNPF